MDTRRLRRFIPVAALVVVIVALIVAGYALLFGGAASRNATSGVATSPSVAAPSAPQPAPDQLATEGSASGSAKGAPTFSGASASTTAEQQLLVRTASMLLRVDDIDATVTRIRDTVSTFDGQIDDLQISSETDVPIYYRTAQDASSAEATPLSAYITVRVPSTRLADFSKKIAAFGKVLRESANQTDVTQQHIDLTARLETLKAEESRLRDFLGAAKTVKDMLAVETELARVRGDIESMQSQLDYLDKQISYGTLTIELQKPAPVVRPTGTDWGFAQAITDGIRGAAGVVRSAITALIALSPVIALVALVWLAVYWSLRRRRRGAADETR
jgi:hypothetical protein